VDGSAGGGDEGRVKLRKARGRRIKPAIPGCPNGETRPADEVGHRMGKGLYPSTHARRTRGSETSQYPEEKKEKSIP